MEHTPAAPDLPIPSKSVSQESFFSGKLGTIKNI